MIQEAETLQLTANIWKAIIEIPRPFPSFKRFIPSVCAFWNVVKGGSDTATKLMDDQSLRVPKQHLNAETAACARIIMLMFVSIHRLIQVETSKKSLKYRSLRSFREAASARTSFHQTLMTCGEALEEEMEMLVEIGKRKGKKRTTVSMVQRKNPSRQKVGGVVPIATTFGASLPYKTPKKLTKSVKDGTASWEINHMVKKCYGIPLKVFPNKQVKCNVCHVEKTLYYCVGCKRWMCMERRDVSKSKKDADGEEETTKKKVIELYSHVVKEDIKTFTRCCYHKEHEAV